MFSRMTVRENLMLGAYLRRDEAGISEDLDRVFTLFPRLKERERQKGGTMSGGEQQMLAIGRALMAQPTLLLLDEPSMGIAPILVERIYETIAEINKQGTTILLVEQNANFALDVSKRGYVLETGKVALADQSASLRRTPRSRRRTWERELMYLAVIGAAALWLTFVWLASAIVASLALRGEGLRREAGPGDRHCPQRAGCVRLGVWPPREISRWKLHGGLSGQARTTLIIVEVVLVAVAAYFVATIDASGGGRIGLVAVALMVLVIAAALVYTIDIQRATGGKTMAELRTERAAD